MVSIIDPGIRKKIEQATGAAAAMCWTCSSCDAECPMNIATNRLRPQKVVRLANLGMAEELISLPEIWYCLTCRRCNRVCPNLVKPETVIRYARAAALQCGAVGHQTLRKYQALFQHFQRARWHMARRCRDGEPGPVTDALWRAWNESPLALPDGPVAYAKLFKGSLRFREAALEARSANCFTCGECSSACPVAGEPGAFDPRFIFRMANLGLVEELLRSPTIWLCLQCERCTDACSQLVDGCRMIAGLRELAVHEGFVDPGFPRRFAEAQKPLYARLAAGIDALFGPPAGHGTSCETRKCLPEALYA
jgi:heterodisulfide reductase subunit C